MAEKPKGTKKTGAKKPAPQEKAVKVEGAEKESREQQPLTVCSATQEMIDLTRREGIETVFDRAATHEALPDRSRRELL